MYSVEDLLISHGYKVSSSSSNNNVPSSHSSSSHRATYDQPPPSRSNSRCEIGDKRTAHGTVNGYKGDGVYGIGGARQTSSRGGPGNTENRDRKQRTEVEDNGNPGDGHSSGDALTTDSGLHDGQRAVRSQIRPERDVSYWRRRGQDFNVLLDYADFRDPHGKGSAGLTKAEGMQRRPESALSSEEHRRERQRRADNARARERELALYQWRMAAERKYQSLGTEEWRPAMGMGRQMSESEVERWSQEQRQPRTAEGAVPPRTKTKSQSLPRMAMPADSVQYLSTSLSNQDPYGSYRQNGHQSREPHGHNLSEVESRERWTDSGRSEVQSAPPSKPRFSRPLRPPSYEVHQQMRGSTEMLSGDFAPYARDRTPLPFSRQDYFAQEPGGSGMEPPGYIPPPSYRRQPAVRGGPRTYTSSMGNYQFRVDPYTQGPAMAEVQEWFMRQTGMSWPDHHRDGRRSMPCRRQAHPGSNEERLGNVQYIPFDDPRVRHISGGAIDGNSLTDADKIRNIRKEIPITPSSEKSTHDSAFLLPEKTLSSTEANRSNISDCVNEAGVHMGVLGDMDNSKLVSDENSNRYPAPAYDTFQARPSQQSSGSDQGFRETVTQVKTFEAQTAAENKKNKKKLKETMFCLVSVPIKTIASKEAADPNNNETLPSSLSQPYHQDLPKISVSSNSTTSKTSEKAPLRKEIVDVWSLQASADKELCYAGSWPGEQYKNQETQTGSPEVLRSAHLPSFHTQAMYEPPPSDTTTTTTESGVGIECGGNYGYPMKGQKNLNLSSNSAFSRTRSGSGSSVKSPAQVVTDPAPPSPDRRPPPKKSASKPQTPDGQEVFGQFLLKPVNRRPWDAIGELESFNKELQDHNSKIPSIEQAIEDLDAALPKMLDVNTEVGTEVNRTGTTPNHVKRDVVDQPRTEQSPPKHFKKGNLNVRPQLESEIAETDQECREGKSAFSRMKREPPNSNMQPRQDMPVVTDNGFAHRLDIPVPKECLQKDVGLTVYTAIPDTVTSESPAGLSPESPMLTSPSDNSEMCEALHITSSDSGGDLSRNSPEFGVGHQSVQTSTCSAANSDHENNAEIRPKVVSGSQKSPHVRVVRSQHFRFTANYDDNDDDDDDDDDDDVYSDYRSWSNEKTLADEHLESLLSQEKANSMPTEDLSNLYQVQCAKGIPVHESIEERAARILGIAVPAESLVVSQAHDRQNEKTARSTNQAEFTLQTRETDSNEDTQDVSREWEEVQEVSVHSSELKMEENDPGIEEESDSVEDKPHVEYPEVSVMLELSEFPRSNLRFSLPATEDEELTLSVCGGDKKVRLGKEVSEDPQDKTSEYRPVCVSRNKEMPAECINPEEEDDSMSCFTSFTKEIENTEETGEEENEKSVRDDKLQNEEKEEFEESEEREEMSEAAVETTCNKMEDRKEEDKEELDEEMLERSKELQKPLPRPVPQPRSGTVVKREITLPETFNLTTVLDAVEDDDVQSVSDTYDPSRVEMV